MLIDSTVMIVGLLSLEVTVLVLEIDKESSYLVVVVAKVKAHSPLSAP